MYILKKEFKSFFTNKGTLCVMFLLPLLLMVIFGFALGDYMKADYNTFSDGKVYYLVETEKVEQINKFTNISNEIIKATGIEFKEVYDLVEAKTNVEKSEAYAVITVAENDYSYFRSSFNESNGGELVRNLFTSLVNSEDKSLEFNIMSEVLPTKQIDSISYYTFSSLGFSILFMGVLVAFSMQKEKELTTLTRIHISKSGIYKIFFAKILAGFFCGIGQIVVAYTFSNLVFDVDWGQYTEYIWVLFLLLSLYSAVFGGVMGAISKSKASCQSNVMMTSMLCGYFGGAISPLFLLENTSFMNILINLSPLYWLNKAVITLNNGILNSSIMNAMFVLTTLIVLLLAVLFVNKSKVVKTI